MAALRHKLAAPSPELAALYGRFQRQLVADPEFRAANIFLSALLGDPVAVAEARQRILEKAAEFRRRGQEDGCVEHHTWCAAPDALRYAAYATWLEFSAAETEQIADGLLHFCYEHAVAVLRSRVPSGNNQSLSMALTCAVVGTAFPGQWRADALREYGLAKLEETLGLFHPAGYSGEGSTYQSHVVSPLVMWAAAFLAQQESAAVLLRPWSPAGGTLLGLLQVEGMLGSPGSLLAPWDHYGWQRKINLAAIACWAAATGQTAALADAATVWDRKTYIAWNSDDRMWALIYWPEVEAGSGGGVQDPASRFTSHQSPAGPLSGWSLPTVGAALDHLGNRSRMLMAWDGSAGDLQGLGRAQVNPNHLMYELAGVPIFGDGVAEAGARFLGVSAAEIAAPLSPEQRRLIVEQYGNLDGWIEQVQNGLIGAANAVVIDHEVAYFPLGSRCGHLSCEVRTPEQHRVTAESVEYYRPRYDLERARRTVAMDDSGLVWLIDDYRAATAHTFTWQLYLRRGATLDGNRLSLCTAEDVAVTLAWAGDVTAKLVEVAGFPKKTTDPVMAWPESGSQRLTLERRGQAARFAVVLMPSAVSDLRVHAVSDTEWRADWEGGTATLRLSAETGTGAAVCLAPEPPVTVNDLAAPPFALLEEPDTALLAALEAPSPAAWRRTTSAMQTLVQRECAAALPAIHRLLTAPTQRYQVHSVAAWCLGRLRYAPALADLHIYRDSPETNTAWRSRWAVEQINNARRK